MSESVSTNIRFAVLFEVDDETRAQPLRKDRCRGCRPPQGICPVGQCRPSRGLGAWWSGRMGHSDWRPVLCSSSCWVSCQFMVFLNVSAFLEANKLCGVWFKFLMTFLFCIIYFHSSCCLFVLFFKAHHLSSRCLGIRSQMFGGRGMSACGRQGRATSAPHLSSERGGKRHALRKNKTFDFCCRWGEVVLKMRDRTSC